MKHEFKNWNIDLRWSNLKLGSKRKQRKRFLLNSQTRMIKSQSWIENWRAARIRTMLILCFIESHSRSLRTQARWNASIVKTKFQSTNFCLTLMNASLLLCTVGKQNLLFLRWNSLREKAKIEKMKDIWASEQPLKIQILPKVSKTYIHSDDAELSVLGRNSDWWKKMNLRILIGKHTLRSLECWWISLRIWKSKFRKTIINILLEIWSIHQPSVIF